MKLKNWKEKLLHMRSLIGVDQSELHSFVRSLLNTLLDELEMKEIKIPEEEPSPSRLFMNGSNDAVKKNNSKIKSLRELLK